MSKQRRQRGIASSNYSILVAIGARQ